MFESRNDLELSKTMHTANLVFIQYQWSHLSSVDIKYQWNYQFSAKLEYQWNYAHSQSSVCLISVETLI